MHSLDMSCVFMSGSCWLLDIVNSWRLVIQWYIQHITRYVCVLWTSPMRVATFLITQSGGPLNMFGDKNLAHTCLSGVLNCSCPCLWKDLMSSRGVNRLPVKTELQKRLELQATMSLDTRHCRIAALPDNCTTLQRRLTWFDWLKT